MKLKWLDYIPKEKKGVTFGYPWPKGKVSSLNNLPVDSNYMQSWPLSYWPDGSIKFSGHAVITASNSKEFKMNQLNKIVKEGITVEENKDSFIVKDDLFEVVINKKGNIIIDSVVTHQGSIQASCGQLIAEILSEEVNGLVSYVKKERIIGEVSDVVIEHSGPFKVSIKVTGHLGMDQKFPYHLRLVFYHQIDEIKLVPTFFVNEAADQFKLGGFGICFQTKIEGSPFNRHIRLNTSNGVYTEPSQLLTTRRYRQSEYYTNQISGNILDLNEDFVFKEAESNALWQDFSVKQAAIDRSIVMKRTDKNLRWLEVPTVKSCTGSMYVGGESGGVSIGIKDFKEKFPAELEVLGVSKEKTELFIWFYSPKGEPFDFRHYSNDTHVESAYEGFPEMRATPIGIANTSEAYIRFYDQPATDESIIDFGSSVIIPPLLISDSEVYYQSNATGKWSMVDKSTMSKAKLESMLTTFIQFYKNEIKQREWYGFWNYGDIMHSYDETRHQWFYDLGGYAWQNTELVPNLWLWYSFFRTTDASIFRMVEAMTRHNSEVDRYHFGPYQGLGSRHNVSHWGCGCKELRISMAHLYQYYYYLTADERMKDLLDEVKDAEHAIDRLDPMREFYSREEAYTHLRVGPDWASLVSNWMSYYERTLDERYLNKIKSTLEDIKNTPHRLLSGPTYQYNPKKNKMLYTGTGNAGGYHMIIAFGAPEVWYDLIDILDDDVFKDMLAEFGRVYAMTEADKRAFSDGELNNNHFHWPMFASSLMIYSGCHDNNLEVIKKGWKQLLDKQISGIPLDLTIITEQTYEVLDEMPWITTNVVSQWSLNVIHALAFDKKVVETVMKDYS